MGRLPGEDSSREKQRRSRVTRTGKMLLLVRRPRVEVTCILNTGRALAWRLTGGAKAANRRAAQQRL